MNALHRLGIYTATEGLSLEELGVRSEGHRTFTGVRHPVSGGVDRGHDVAILFHGVPLMEEHHVTGVLTLVRESRTCVN